MVHYCQCDKNLPSFDPLGADGWVVMLSLIHIVLLISFFLIILNTLNILFFFLYVPSSLIDAHRFVSPLNICR